MPRVIPAPADDYEYKTFEFNGETYRVKSKFKIFKFFKALNENPVTAMELAIEEEDYEKLCELDIDMNDFKVILEAISNTLAGDTAGN